MDHEYSISGNLWADDAAPDARRFPCEYTFEELVFELVPAESRVSVTLKDRARAAEISKEKLVEICRRLSLEYGAKVGLCRTHEVYGVANVFNGGSDYEVVSEERFVCEFENGAELKRETIIC